MNTILRKYLKKDDKTLIWFWRTYIIPFVDISYSGFRGQLSGRSPLKCDVSSLIDNYIADVDRQKSTNI